MKTKLISRISYSDIFKEKESVSQLIGKADVLKSLEFLSIINKYEYRIHEKANSEIQFILTEWLVNENQKIKKQILDCFIELSEKKRNRGVSNDDFSSVNIINRASTLRLLEIFSSQDPKQKNVDEKENSLILFKLYLLVSTEISNRQDKIFSKLFSKKKNLMDDIQFHLLFGLTHPFLKSNMSKLIVPEVLKFIQFEKWVREHKDYSEMTNNYIKNIGLNNWYEYFNDVFSLSNISISNHKVSIKSYPVLIHVLNFFSSDNNFSSQWSELVNLKKQPIIRLDDEFYLILDSEFLLNKFFSGLYHDILKYSETKFGNKFSQDYNSLFIEEVLLVNCIQSVFGKSYIKFSEREIKEFNQKGIDNLGLPDYYIRNGNKVFLFECKNSFISNANKVNLETDELLMEIKTKFYYDDSKGPNKSKNKAVKQLMTYIINSSQNKFAFFDKVKKNSNLVYYPILVVTDYTLCSIGFNQLLNEYMKMEIQKSENLNRNKIKPLTIIHIDDFLYHQTALKKLDAVILKYHYYLKNKDGFDSMISFTDYLDTELFRGRAPLLRKNIEHILEDSLLPAE